MAKMTKVKKTATKKAPAKKVAAKKASSKKVAAKKAAAKKVATKKAPAKKVATKKATAKKVTTKKAPAKKVATKKAPAKKVVAKKETKDEVKAPTLEVGMIAPEFTLMDQNGNEVSLHDFKGSNVVVYFYPKAMTPGCTVQACELRNSEASLKEASIVVLGISADPVKSLKKFEEKEKLNFTLLSDPEHKAIASYGVWGPKKFMGKEFDGIHRQSFLIDKEGKIVHIMHKVDTKTHHSDVLNFFKSL